MNALATVETPIKEIYCVKFGTTQDITALIKFGLDTI